MSDLSQTIADTPPLDTLARAVWRGQNLIDLGADAGEEPETQLTDVLADLMHWANHHHVLWEDALAGAARSRQAELEDWDVVHVRIENTYSDGHESVAHVWVPAPEDPEDLGDWWEDVVFEHTGDGHDTDGELGSLYEATIVGTYSHHELLGQRNEWGD